VTAETLKAPFPYFGGKRLVADSVWAALGDVPNYVEPFAGSLAVLLGRPHAPKIETVNDVDGYVSNFWRAVKLDPGGVIEHADWPVNENDLHARNAYLTALRGDFVARLEGDPNYYDAKVAGWWVWGKCASIGYSFVGRPGPWTSQNGRLVRGAARNGITRSLPRLGDGGNGINRLTDGSQREYIEKQIFALADRLRKTRVACGDWKRITSPAVTLLTVAPVTGVFLDPPYGVEDRDRTYFYDNLDIAADVREWCLANGDKPQLRIVLCGFTGEGHEALEDSGWTVVTYARHPGYGQPGTRGHLNAAREAMWFSPHCLQPNQAGLFAPPAGGQP